MKVAQIGVKIRPDLYNELMIAGNHLACALILKDPMFQNSRHKTYGSVLEAMGSEFSDVWLAWKTIMDIRDAATRGA